MSDLDLLTNQLGVENLFSRYAHTVDTYDADGWLDCFAQDVIFEVVSDGVGIQFVGQEALHEFINAHIRLLPGTRHVMTNHIVEFDGNRVQHRCTLTVGDCIDNNKTHPWGPPRSI